MEKRDFISILFKVAAFQIVFLWLHFAYDWFSYPWVAVFSGNSEGVFQHQKIAFLAYSIVCVLEFFLLRKKISSPGRFFDSRLLASLLLPWMIFFWYLGPVLLQVPMPNDLLEILYANIVTILVCVALVLLERDFYRIDFSRTGRIIMIVMYVISAFLFVSITFQVPWAGYFVQ
ncbi:MAG: hypothetical protein HGA53_05215 [Anaerolineaceae bacterium]|nr:hypothetical protein [Anaerolineaceae bacterium]